MLHCIATAGPACVRWALKTLFIRLDLLEVPCANDKDRDTSYQPLESSATFPAQGITHNAIHAHGPSK